MKPLTLEETKLKEEMKERCIAKGQYKDKNAKAKFNMLCHLEDFEIQYWELQKENKQLKENAENNDKVVDNVNWENQLLKKENQKLKEQNKKEFADYIKFKKEQYDEYLEKVNKLIKEKQELKKHLKVPKACNLKTLEDYKSYYEDTTREQILEDTYIEYCAYVNLAHRYSELKKQLENNSKINVADHKYASTCEDKVIVLETQQKEFIKYLEDEIKQINPKILDDGELNLRLDDIKYTQYLTYKEILQKYKEMIGVPDDKTN